MDDSNLFPAPIKAVDHDLNLDLLKIILNKAPRLLREGLLLAAVPYEYNVPLLAALRQRNDGRDERLVKRLVNYSFIRRVEDGYHSMEAAERDFLQRKWLKDDVQAFRAAHERAAIFLEDHPTSDPITHTHNLIYHFLISDANRGTELFIKTFQAYINEHFLAAADHLVATANDAYPYISSESATYSSSSNDTLSGFWSSSHFDDLLLFCQARLSQLRGERKKSYVTLSLLEGKKTLPKRLRPYVERAYGLALTHSGLYVEAIEFYHKALMHFYEQKESEIEQGHTLMMLGDAYVDLGMAARGYRERLPSTTFIESWKQALGNLSLFAPLPIMIYLARHKLYFWHPRSWHVLLHQDWIIASLFAWGARTYREADKLLESLEGKSLEWNRADQKLAQLYLRLGDAHQAIPLFQALLDEEEGEYTRTLMKLGLASSWLQLGKVNLAEQQLQTILPIVKNYEEPLLKAQVIALLAEAKLRQEHDDTIDYFAEALELYIEQEDIGGATETVERLESIIRDSNITITNQQSEMIAHVANRLPWRQYQVRFHHSTFVNFRRLSLIFIGILIFLVPYVFIDINTVNFLQLSTSLTIPQPLTEEDFETTVLPIFQSLAKPSLELHVVMWQLLFMGLIYAVIYLVMGLILIVRTQLYTLQEATKSKIVRLNAKAITIGEDEQARTIKWHDVTHLVSADLAWWKEPMPKNSVTIIATANEKIVLEGATAWYKEITERISSYVNEDALRINLSYSLFRSPLGAWYAVSVFCLLLFIIASQFSFLEYRLNSKLFGSIYSLVDLYPYFYLGLLIPPLWWAVGRPLINRARLKRHLPVAGFVFAGGLICFALHWSRLFAFQNLPHIYLSLSSIVLFGSVLIAFWQAKDATIPTFSAQEATLLFGHKMQPVARTETNAFAQVRLALLTLLLTSLIFGLAVSLVFEVAGYHYLVLGSHKLSQVSQLEEKMGSSSQQDHMSDERIDLLEEAIMAYSASLRVVPLPRYLAALGGRAAATTQLAVATQDLKKFKNALDDYDEGVDLLPDDSTVYSDRAIAYTIRSLTLKKQVKELSKQGQSIGQDASRLSKQAEEDYQNALKDMKNAIDRSDDDSEFESQLYLWRIVLYNSAEEWNKALEEADRVIKIDKENSQGYLNKGWAYFQIGNNLEDKTKNRQDNTTAKILVQKADRHFEKAIINFDEAGRQGYSSTDLQLATGYAYYKVEDYDMALQIWGKVIELEPNNRLAFVLRGTTHWRIATRQGSVCDSTMSLPDEKDEFIKTIKIAIDNFDAALALEANDAFTYHTRAQLRYLLQNCPGHHAQQELQSAVDDYTLAISYDPENDMYWHGRARMRFALGYNYFVMQQESIAFDLLEEAKTDIELAYRIENNLNNKKLHDLITLNGQRSYYLRRGDAYAEAQTYAAALADYEMAAEELSEPNSDALEATFGAGLMAVKLNQIDTATQWYKKGITQALDYNRQSFLYIALERLDEWIRMHPEEENALQEIRQALKRALE